MKAAPPMIRAELAHNRKRLANRLPLIGGWLQQRAVRRLVQDGSPEAIPSFPATSRAAAPSATAKVTRARATA